MFRLSKEEVRVLLSAAVLLSAGIAIGVGIRWHRGSSQPEVLLPVDEIEQARQVIKQANHRAEKPASPRSGRLFPFDPNHADSLTLIQLGLREWQVRNMLKYRRKGGRWRTPDDLKRLYGLSSGDFERLKPYIRIAPEDRRTYLADDSRRETESDVRSSGDVTYIRTEKYPEGTVLPINEADTTALKAIPGIGSYYARKIVQYRERLGGFVSVHQVDEIEGLPAGISRWFTLGEEHSVRRIPINRASFKQLLRHPYLSYEQTKAIVNHIRSYGPLRSWNDLRLYKEFTPSDFVRLEPYFIFN